MFFGGCFQRLPFQDVIGHFQTSFYRIRQHLLAIILKERKHETPKETSQNTSETVPTLKSGTCKNRYLSTVLHTGRDLRRTPVLQNTGVRRDGIPKRQTTFRVGTARAIQRQS